MKRSKILAFLIKFFSIPLDVITTFVAVFLFIGIRSIIKARKIHNKVGKLEKGKWK